MSVSNTKKPGFIEEAEARKFYFTRSLMHVAQSGAKSGQWVKCKAEFSCPLGGTHTSEYELKYVQDWAGKRSFSEVTPEDQFNYKKAILENNVEQTRTPMESLKQKQERLSDVTNVSSSTAVDSFMKDVLKSEASKNKTKPPLQQQRIDKLSDFTPELDTENLDSLYKMFLEGDCWAFAIEVEKKTGWPVYTISASDQEWFHAVNKRPDGSFVDISGAHKDEDMLYDWQKSKGRAVPNKLYYRKWTAKNFVKEANSERVMHFYRRSEEVAEKWMSKHSTWLKNIPQKVAQTEDPYWSFRP